MSPLEALDVAARARPARARPTDAAASDPPLGTWLALRPEEYVTDEIVGDLVYADRDELAIHRLDSALGDVVVHFPRVGYALRLIEKAAP